MKRISKDLEDTYVKAGYVICNTKRFVILKQYPKGNKSKYLKDILDPFQALFVGILGILIFPIGLIMGLSKTLPKIKLKEKYNKL